MTVFQYAATVDFVVSDKLFTEYQYTGNQL